MGVFGFLAILFVVVPIVELMLLIELGQAVGLIPTLLLVLTTGVLGAMLARAEGLRTFLRFQGEVASGQIPGQSIFDGISVLVGGVLLLTPGLLTDLVGFALMVPLTRRWIQRRARARLTRMVEDGAIQVVTLGPDMRPWTTHGEATTNNKELDLDPANEIAVEDSSS